jgi:esterase/lipase superfamily enzyme
VLNPFDTTQTVTLFYATDRGIQDPAPQCLDPFFSTSSGGELRFGQCRISVPVNREVGTLDLATEAGSNVHTTFRSLEHVTLNRDVFFEKTKSVPEDVLVFVHGFNVRFEEAAFRASQILFDTKFQGTAFLFSWPAGAPDRFLSSAYLAKTYSDNQKNAAQSVEHFQEFLQGLIDAKKRIFLVVHSMGHQVVLPALLKIPGNTFVQELVLNAPDYSAEDFEAQKMDWARVARRVTLYCSPADNALLASARLNKKSRAGTCQTFSGVDVVNVSHVDKPTLGFAGLGHGYYSGRPVLGDLSQVFLGLKAEKRLFIQKSFQPDRENYALRK